MTDSGKINVVVDGKTLSTHGKHPLVVPTQALADAIAQEWNVSSSAIRHPSSAKPLTAMANTAIDRIATQQEAIVEALLVYLDTDTLTYRDTASPSPLAGEGRDGGAVDGLKTHGGSPHPSTYAKASADANPPPQGGREYNLAGLQHQQWDPVLAWAQKRFGVAWTVSKGIMPAEQPEALHAALRSYLNSLDAMCLAATTVLAGCYSSLVLAVAVADKHLGSDIAFRLSRLEEDFQARQWGRDEEELRATIRLKEDVAAAGRFLSLLEAP